MTPGRLVRGLGVVVCVISVVATTGAASPRAADPAPFRDKSGLLVLSAAEVNQPAPESQRDALGAYDLLAETNPDDFGYPHVSSGAIVVDVVTNRGAQLLAKVDAGEQLSPTALDPEAKAVMAIEAHRTQTATQAVVQHRVAASRTELERLKHDLADPSQADRALVAAGIWQTEVDRARGLVVARLANLTDDAATRLVALYGTERVAVIVEPNPESVDTVGRLADNSPFYGGARVNAPAGSCTDAFSWNITSTVQGMLTAGHCAPNGGSVSTLSSYLGSITSGSRENYSSSGTVYLPGQTVYRGDMALAQVTSGKSSSGRIYRGAYNSTSSNAVRSMWSRRAQPADQYCTGGSYSGEICGWTVSAAGVDRYVSGKWKRNIVVSRSKQGWCMRGGDSGGAVYTVNSDGSVAAKGIHNSSSGGGSDYYGGALDPCYEQFTDIWDAYLGFPGTLKTS